MKKKTMKILFVSIAFYIGLCTLNTDTQAYEPPSFIERNDGGHSMGNGSYVTTSYQLIRQSYDEIKGTATYNLGEYFTITGNGAQAKILSDYVYLTNRDVTKKYIGVFDKHNGWQSNGTYTRDAWLPMVLTAGDNTIIMSGEEGAVAGSGDSTISIYLDKIGNDPVVHGVNGEWIAGEVTSGKRTWQSLYTDGATGSENGNKIQTSTGFTYSDEDEQKTPVSAYMDVPISKNSYIDQIQKQNADGSWSIISNSDWKVMDNTGSYWIRSCTTDQADYKACGSRYITVTQKKYSIKYNKNDTGATGSMANSVHKYDEAKKLTANAFSKTGYHFSAWNEKSDGTGKSYADEQSIKNLSSINNATVTLYAQWLPNTYFVKYNSNGGTGSMSNSTHIYDALKALSTTTFTRNGWKFVGWNSKSDGTGTAYYDKEPVKNITTKNGEIINIFAQWNQAPSIIANAQSFYEGEITAYDWVTKKRMHGVSASDREDGNITNKVIVASDDVITDKAGTYSVKYHVIDSVDQIATKTVAVTVKENNPPTITTIDRSFYENEISENEWKTLRLKEITASDIEDGDLTSQIEIIKDDVNVKQHGTYEVTYRVTDKYGKSATKTVKITVKENSAPLINAKDRMYWLGNITQIDWLNTLRMADVTATDTEDGNLTSDVEIKLDEVKVTAAGIYRVVYQVADRFGKIAEKMIQVEIRYNNKPIIAAENVVFHENEYDNETLFELLKENAVASDHEDGDLTKDIMIIENGVDPEKAGSYTVIYKVTDSLGESTTKVIDVTVLENHAPRLQLFAPSKRFIEGEYSQEEWEDELRMSGVSAHDHEDHDLTNEIEVIEDTTIASTAGIYQVTYKVTDSFGKSVTVKSKVTVEPNEPPVIYASDKHFKTSDLITEKDLLKSVYASDDHDGDLTKVIRIASNNVINGKVGIYEVTYEVTDRFGKVGTKTIKVHIEQMGAKPSQPSDPMPSDPNALGLWNGRQFAKINLTKLMEKSEINDDPDTYKDVLFGIYAAEDIIYKDEVVLPKDSMIGISHVDENGNVDVVVYHAGKYYIQELSTNENYQLDINRYYFDFEYK